MHAVGCRGPGRLGTPADSAGNKVQVLRDFRGQGERDSIISLMMERRHSGVLELQLFMKV